MRIDKKPMVTYGLQDLRLMQLISPTLPIGGFTYSQGLEWATENGQIESSENVTQWMLSLIKDNLTYLDLPILKRLYDAFHTDDRQKINHWSEYLLACRETSELRQEEINRGRALCRLLIDLNIAGAEEYKKVLQLTQIAGFSLACVVWEIPIKQAALGYSWSWLENQISAAVKLIPLGQTDGQKIQLELANYIPQAVEKSLTLQDDELGASAPTMAIASSLHEIQYTRLFRS